MISPAITIKRLRVSVEGVVQGVGFRPFIHQLARQMALNGWVQNTPQGLMIEAEGTEESLLRLLTRLQNEHPQPSVIHRIQHAFHPALGYESFTIKPSRQEVMKSAPVLADLASCQLCITEIFDPSNRRYLYPFTSCTHCGPRFSIVTAVPYDRANTTMAHFPMCPDCEKEYLDPTNRRFHAQPNACPSCGPRMAFWDNAGMSSGKDHEAIIQAAEAIKKGAIVAIKGVGGFHLIADASNVQAVNSLRQRKRRRDKPLALMFPCLSALERFAVLNEVERELLISPASPIVLVQRRKGTSVAEAVAPANPTWGVMLPYSPLHHILMRELNRPIVATSGNISDEPICTDELEALERLNGIADYFLVHNRPIARAVDDSVVRIIHGRKMIMRRSRGYAPLPIRTEFNDKTVMAMGGQLKSAVALKIQNNIFTSAHLGDLTDSRSQEAFDRAVENLRELYSPNLECIAHDTHPDYVSSAKADHLVTFSATRCAIQHHFAHILSCMADNQLQGQVLGISWDGTGHGEDNTVWGGEFLLADLKEYTRVGTLLPFRLVGSEKAIAEPRRAALGILYELSDDPLRDYPDLTILRRFSPEEYRVFRNMHRKNLNSPLTTSMGRLFDGLAALLGLYERVSYEGQAAMALEYLCEDRISTEYYPFEIATQNEILAIDWRPLIQAAIKDNRGGNDQGFISVKFHNALVEAALAVAQRIQQNKVVLSGGCFQNKYLSERMIQRLIDAGFTPYWHHEVPPNDGGLCVGQALGASNQ